MVPEGALSGTCCSVMRSPATVEDAEAEVEILPLHGPVLRPLLHRQLPGPAIRVTASRERTVSLYESLKAQGEVCHCTGILKHRENVCHCTNHLKHRDNVCHCTSHLKHRENVCHCTGRLKHRENVSLYGSLKAQG